MSKCQVSCLVLLLSFLVPSVSHAYENLVLQGTIDEISQDILAALKAKNFNKAEETLQNLLLSRRKSPHGTRMLEEVYDELAASADSEMLDQWCTASLQSHFPLLLRANHYTRKAKDLRANNYARQISEETWKTIKDYQVKAQVDYESAYAINTEDAAIPAGMVAISLLRAYPYDVMEDWFQKSIKADPNWLKPYREKLYFLAPWWHGTQEKMEAFVKECYEKSPEGSVVYTIPLEHLSIFYKIDFFRGDYLPYGMKLPIEQETMVADAIRRFQKECPKSPQPDYYQGLFYSMGGSHEDALRSFKQAEAKDPRFVAAWTGEVYSQMVLDRPDKAEAALHELLRIDTDSPFALMNLGYLKMVRQNDYPGGMKLFFDGVGHSNSVPYKTDGLYRLAQFLKSKEKYREAIECFSKALEFDPNHTKSLLGRAVAKSSIGEYDSAMDDALTAKNSGGRDADDAGRVAEEILKAQDKSDQQKNHDQAASTAASSADNAGQPSVHSPPVPAPAPVQDPQEAPKQVVTADIRQTVAPSPTAVSDNSALQERFSSCEELYFRRLKDQAIDCFSSLLLEAPEYPKTFFMLGQIAEKLEADLKKATRYYTQAVSKDQANLEYMFRLGKVLYMDRNFPEAIQVMTKLIELSPANGEAFYQRGLCFDALGQKEQAIEDMQKASMYAGKSEAVDYLNRNVASQPPPQPKIDKEQELISLSEQNFTMQRYDQAEKQLREVLDINPKNDLAIFKLGVIYIYRDRDHKKAIEQYDEAIDLNGTYKDYFLSRAAAYRYLEEYQKEADDYTRALKLSPNEGYIYGERADCMMKLGKYEDAAQDLKKAMELSPDRRDRYNRLLAEISAKTGMALDEGSASPAVLLERGRRYAEQKDFDKAKKDMEQAISLDPQFAQAYYEMGRMHMEKMRLLDEAIPYFSKAIELDSNNRDYFFRRGLVYFEKKDYNNARTDFTRALEIQKDDTQVYYYRGVCNKELGQKDQAVEDLLKARKDSGWAQAVDGLLNSMM